MCKHLLVCRFKVIFKIIIKYYYSPNPLGNNFMSTVGISKSFIYLCKYVNI